MDHRMLLAAGALALAATPAVQGQQNYPTKPITMIIPFAAGGPTDVVGRMIGQSMRKTLGQTVVVENVGGAGGTPGAAKVANAAPDGYTILLHHSGQSTAPSLHRPLRYDVNNFETSGWVADVPMPLIARGNFPASDLKGMSEHGKANKDKINLANAGVGSASHLGGMLFKSTLGVDVSSLPYKGTAPARNDLLGGQVDIMCDQTTNTTPYIKGGCVKADAVTTPKRNPSLPNLPPTREAGLPQLEVAVWHGLDAPKGTSKDAVVKRNNALTVALKDAQVVERFAGPGTEPVAENRTSPEVPKQFLTAKIGKGKTVIEQSKEPLTVCRLTLTACRSMSAAPNMT